MHDTSHELDDKKILDALHGDMERLFGELKKVIVGQGGVLNLLVVALLARGHALMVGVPGLAKTLMIKTLARCLDLRFQRIQFTPDLMPTDITGTEILEEDRTSGAKSFRFIGGPVFTNILLADEINRTPPKTQAALLQSMQELKVTVLGTTHELERPFLVLATQNPIEQEGTYPLPEAQLDRFMINVPITYPSFDEEVHIARGRPDPDEVELAPVMGPVALDRYQNLVVRVPVSSRVVEYAVKLAQASRPDASRAPEVVSRYVTWGAGPRASQHLILAAKALAAMRGKYAVTTEEIRTLAAPVLGHRLVLNFHAEAERVTPEAVVRELLDHVKE